MQSNTVETGKPFRVEREKKIERTRKVKIKMIVHLLWTSIVIYLYEKSNLCLTIFAIGRRRIVRFCAKNSSLSDTSAGLQ